MSDIARLYRDAIKQHAADPVGYRRKINATHSHEEYNPLCGDRILMQLQITEDQVVAAAFDGEACAICMASASLLCVTIPGKPVSHLHEMHDKLQAALDDNPDTGDIDALKPLLGVKRYPSRIRCATLPWSTARKAL